MTVNPQNDQVQSNDQPKVSDKELNFRKQEEVFKRQIEQERLARQQLEERLAQVEREKQQSSQRSEPDDDDLNDEPYVDKRSLSKRLNKFEQQLETKIDQKAEAKARKLMEEERKSSWLRNNPDFYDIMQHAQTLAEKHPDVAESILEMPESFARQQLVYKQIKALNLHKKEEPRSSVQDRIEQNRRSPYYQPSGIGTAPYASQGDYSPSGQKNAYDKMKELQKKLRI